MKKISLLSALGLTLPLAAAPLFTPVEIHQPTGRPLPVSFSVPLPRGQNTGNLTVRSAGEILPLQSRVLSSYPDQSPKWVQLTVPSVAGKVEVTTANGAPAAVSQPVKVTRQGPDFDIGNALLKLAVKPESGTITLTRGGETLNMSLPEMALEKPLTPQLRDCRMQENGPLKAVLRLSGGYRETAGRYWELFLTAYAGVPWIEAEVVFGFSTSTAPGKNTAREEMTSTRSAALRLTGNFSGKRLTAYTPEGTAFDAGKSLVHWEFDRYAVDGGALRTGRISGVFAVKERPWTPVVSIPEMAEQYPLGVSFTANALSIDFMPAILPADRYAGRPDEHIHTYYLRSGSYEFRGGVEKSYTVYLGLTEPDADSFATAAALQTLPVGIPDIAAINRSGAWPHRIVPASPGTARYDEAVRTGADAYFGRQQKERWYGLLNWGDWFGEREFNWGNHEYDTPTVFFEQGLRLNNPDYIREAIRGSRHFIDVDVVKRNVNPDHNGGVWAHAIGHTGGYYGPNSFKLFNYGQSSEIFISSRHTAGHTRARGTALAYLFTGNERFREQAQAIGNFICKDPMFRRRNWPSTAREPGWALFNLCSLHFFLGDPKFLDAANQLADIVIERAEGRGVKYCKLASWNAPDKPGGLRPEDRRDLTGELSFPTGYQCAGMIELYNLTGRKDVLENLGQCADYIMERLYFPDRKGFVHSPVPWRRQSTRLGGSHAASLRYALAFNAAVNQRRDLLPVIEDTMNRMFERQEVFDSPLKGEKPDWPHPKSFSSALYLVPQTLSYLEKVRQP